MTMERTAPPLRMLRLPQVIARTGLSRSTIYEIINKGKFPRQVSLGPHSVGWVEREVDAWIAERIESSRALKQQFFQAVSRKAAL